ncbi:hypothetical protein GVN18_40765 [Pseudomonas sp. ODNR1LW]|nr:hypothetical protein [Pseudomonas sp. ODNR1LW]
MSRLTVFKTSEAQAVVEEAEALERETRLETARLIEIEDESVLDGFEESQTRYRELRAAAQIVVAILYRMQEPLREDPYAPLAAKCIGKAKALLSEIEDGELVEKVSLVPASDKE